MNSKQTFKYRRTESITTSKNNQNEKEINESPPEATVKDYAERKNFIQQYSTEPKIPEVKIRWFRVVLIGIIIGLFVSGLTVLIVWLIYNSNPDTFAIFLLPWIFLTEFGLLFTFGGCIGFMKQSYTIEYIRKRLQRGKEVSNIDTKIAIGSAYTYIFAGIIIAIASYVSWYIIYK